MRLLLTLAALVSFTPTGLAAQWDRPGLQPVRLGKPSNCARLSPPLRVITSVGSGYDVPQDDPCLAHSSVDSVTPGGLTALMLSEALAGRIAGVSVLRSSGVIGTGSRVRIRGGSGLLVPREPIVIIDGVRVDGSQSSLGIDIGGQAPSRLDDLPMHEVERVTILRGPAGTALYGADAAGGVILVTTHRGQGGTPRWKSWADGGVMTDVTAYPANFGTGPPTYGQETCTRADAALGSCTPGPLSRWNPL